MRTLTPPDVALAAKLRAACHPDATMEQIVAAVHVQKLDERKIMALRNVIFSGDMILPTSDVALLEMYAGPT
jgi:hypothetical protein